MKSREAYRKATGKSPSQYVTFDGAEIGNTCDFLLWLMDQYDAAHYGDGESMYVASYIEEMRGGCESGAMLFGTEAEALEWITGLANGFNKDCLTFRLHKLGEEVPIKIVQAEAPQPPVVKWKAVKP